VVEEEAGAAEAEEEEEEEEEEEAKPTVCISTKESKLAWFVGSIPFSM